MTYKSLDGSVALQLDKVQDYKTAWLRHDAKAHPLIWLIAFLFIGIAVSQAGQLIQDHATISVMAGLLIGALLGHLFW
jgi:hypothetical protein